MTQRFEPVALSAPVYEKFVAMSGVLRERMEPLLLDLVNLRVSQINGCAFCVDMHAKEAKIHGERELRLYHVAVWRDSDLFTERERAALAWAEALTVDPAAGVPDALYAEVSEHLTERELSDLTFAVVEINGWNRLNVAVRRVPGSFDEVLGLAGAGLA